MNKIKILKTKKYFEFEIFIEEKNIVKIINDFLKEISVNRNIFLEVLGEFSETYKENFQIIEETQDLNNKIEKTYNLKEFSISDNISNCMSGTAYIVKKELSWNDFLKTKKKRYIDLIITEISFNDIGNIRFHISKELEQELYMLLKRIENLGISIKIYNFKKGEKLMRNAVKYVYDGSWFYVHLKKHVCPKCGKKLELRYISKIVNSKSQEAKNYDFLIGDTFFSGDVEFRTKCFHCSDCNFDISVKEMKEIESKKQKKKVGDNK